MQLAEGLSLSPAKCFFLIKIFKKRLNLVCDYTVTRYWNKKLQKFFQKLNRKQPLQFLL